MKFDPLPSLNFNFKRTFIVESKDFKIKDYNKYLPLDIFILD